MIKEVEERVQKAQELFTAGYNCAQAVFLAYADLFAIPSALAATLAAPFGGGMGRLREVCGAVSGMALVAGCVEPFTNPADREAKTRNYTLVQKWANAYRAENGAIVCRELLGLSCRQDSPVPSERTAAYYKKRPCRELVGVAARIVGETLAERGILRNDMI